jgi:hypothetical protein
MLLPFNIDAPCGRYFRYRDLIECGDTWHQLRTVGSAPSNIPQERETISAIQDICSTILDPVVDAFGKVLLTYGFSSAELAAKIACRISPSLDQHAGCEKTKSGRAICDRAGMAADFHVPAVSSTELARWVCSTARFDRLYFYGPNNPLHVSVGPANTGQVVMMEMGPSGRRIPRVVSVGDFIHREPRPSRAGTTDRLTE